MGNSEILAPAILPPDLPFITLTMVAQPEVIDHDGRQFMDRPDHFSNIAFFLHGRTQPFPEDLARERDGISGKWATLNRALPMVDHVVDSGAPVAIAVGNRIIQTLTALGSKEPILQSEPALDSTDFYFTEERLASLFGKLKRHNSQHAIVIAAPDALTSLLRATVPDAMTSFPQRYFDGDVGIFQARDWDAMKSGKTHVIGSKMDTLRVRCSLERLHKAAEAYMALDSTLRLEAWIPGLQAGNQLSGSSRITMQEPINIARRIGAPEKPKLERRRDF